MSNAKPGLVGVIGEFRDVNSVVTAAKEMKNAGYESWDIYTPYPVHGLDKHMGVKRSILSYISFAGMVIGLSTALLMQWWMNSVDFALNIGGKQFFAWQFSIPIDFELSILGTAIFTVFGLFHLCKLPTWYNDFQDDESFKKSTDDTIVIAISAKGNTFTESGAVAILNKLGAENVHPVHRTEL